MGGDDAHLVDGMDDVVAEAAAERTEILGRHRAESTGIASRQVVHGYRRGKLKIDFAVAPLQKFARFDHLPDILRLLLSAFDFMQVGGLLEHAVVADGCRNENQILTGTVFLGAQ